MSQLDLGEDTWHSAKEPTKVDSSSGGSFCLSSIVAKVATFDTIVVIGMNELTDVNNPWEFNFWRDLSLRGLFLLIRSNDLDLHYVVQYDNESKGLLLVGPNGYVL